MRKTVVYAPAKLNLYLDVLEKRSDGYHDIETLFEKIDLKDEISIAKKDKGIDVRVEPSAACPSGKDNIVYKALQTLFNKTGSNAGLEVVIKKRIPVSAGLGGGSSDAAAVLRAVNEGFKLGLSFETLFSIAGEIGKDVPFFMLDQSFAVGTGSGEALEALDEDSSFSHLVIKPAISIPTAEMYKRLERRAINKKKGGLKEITSAIRKNDIELLSKAYYNIFESVLGDYKRHIDEAKALLFKAGAGPGFLSGSGPSVFCTVKDRKEAAEILGKISNAGSAKIFLATTYKGGIYGDNRG